MKFTLKDYQRDAVIQVLDNLERALAAAGIDERKSDLLAEE